MIVILQNKKNLPETIITEDNTLMNEKFEMPIAYLLCKEYFRSFCILISSSDKEIIIKLQNTITTEKLLKMMLSENLLFNFDFKQYLLIIFNTLNLKTYHKPNVFENNKEFELFMVIIIVDMAFYLTYNINFHLQSELFLLLQKFFFLL